MTKLEILGDLGSTRCRCGSVKKARRSVCVSCWRLLTESEQRALYKRFGNGYEAAYEAVLKSLGFHPEVKGAA